MSEPRNSAKMPAKFRQRKPESTAILRTVKEINPGESGWAHCDAILLDGDGRAWLIPDAEVRFDLREHGEPSHSAKIGRDEQCHYVVELNHFKANRTHPWIYPPGLDTTGLISIKEIHY